MNGRTTGVPICFFIVTLVPHRRNVLLIFSLTLERTSFLRVTTPFPFPLSLRPLCMPMFLDAISAHNDTPRNEPSQSCVVFESQHHPKVL
jgi:hypothetical protein